MQNILVPTDFSAQAHNAFEVALQLAQRTGGHITLLHVVDLPGGAGVSSSGGPVGGSGMNDVFVLKLLQVTKHHMHELKAEAHRLAPEVPVHDEIRTEDLDTAILAEIKEKGIDLVVMGAHVHTTDHFFSDSHTERVVRLSPCPVLTVKHAAPHFDVQHLVFASDFSPEADTAVPGLRQIQAAFPNATLHLLDVVPNAAGDSEALQRIQNFASRHQLAHYQPDVYHAPKVSTAIPRFADQTHADLVVMLTHGRTGLSHYLQGSIAESVAVHANSPVLTLHT
ncbi:universal stress protein [Hymenobacter koreensis]|uniref:Universal stress protein n=1 Tax=Hymenobacter koreensis TaxID=1084523 RepID=A0ABP8J228_9BACT